MRRTHRSLTPAAARSLAADALARALPWRTYRSVTAGAPRDLVLLVAALGSSLRAAARRFRFGFSHETARQALGRNLPQPDELAEGLVDALHGFLPRGSRRRAWDIALDRHDAPFYGRRGTPGVLGGPRKGGTNRSFAYATAAAVHRGRRWCPGLVRLTDADAESAVPALLGQLRHREIPIRSLVLDRGFFSGHVILASQQRGVPLVPGVPRKGGKWNELFESPSGRVVSHSWKTERGSRPVSVSAARSCRRVRGRWHREVFAFEGVGPGGVVSRWGRAGYYRGLMRRRLGVETGYRQLNQGKALTSSTGPRRRLLWPGVALLLRRVWVRCQRATAGVRADRSARRPAESLRLAVVLGWPAGELERRHPAGRKIQLPQPITLPRAHPLHT
jgi:hypothetical protein